MDNILGFTIGEWTEIGIAVLVIIFGFTVVGWLVKSFLRWLSHRTPTDLDDRLVESVGGQIKWLVGLIITQLTIIYVDILAKYLRDPAKDVFFVLYLVTIFIAAWRITNVTVDWYREKAKSPKEAEKVLRVSPALKRLAHLLLFALGLTILFSYFNIDITAFIAALGIGTLAISLAAQDVLADLISGVLIYFDQPFRIGDRIDVIEDTNTGGEVVDIGIRTTRICTPDNRIFIVPNSMIAKGKIINYTFPDTRYQIFTHIGVGYRSDADQVRRILIDTVRKVDGVLSDRLVAASLVDFRNSTMFFRVSWWINTYLDAGPTTDRVNSAIFEALDKAGIEVPIMTYDINFKISPEAASQLSQALR